jgi:tRNA threonylcarbamoyladenosine modification (KEOPS) complex  Pcc1 subunit
MSVKELRKITVNIPFRNENIALIVYQSILPEATNRKSVRGQVKAEIRSNKIILTFYSRKTTIIRALWNSYIRWILSIVKVLEIFNK